MTWKGNILFVLLWGYYDLSKVYATSSDNLQRKLRQSHHQHDVRENNGIIQDERRILSDMMRPGDRVSAMDKESAICSANLITDREIATEQTVIDYYYAIESSEVVSTNDSTGRSMIRELEDKIFRAISPAVLWCYYEDNDDNDNETPPTRRLLSHNSPLNSGDSSSLQAGGFERDGLRRLTLEEARRLSIVSFSTSPEDEQTSIECKFPTSSDHCIVMHGMVTIMHHVTSDVSLAVASIYDSTQKTMDSGELFMLAKRDKDFFHVTNIKWLGETEQEAITAEVVVVTGGEKSVSAIVAGIQSVEEEKSMSMAYAMSILLLVLLALILLFVGHRTRRKARLQEKLLALESFDNENLVGTGDPPGSFHEGMYHYTRNGARYLSTNCHDCIETRKNGFLTSCGDELDEIPFSEREQSNNRKRNLVTPSSGALGMKHSSIDVHNCSSGACKICAHRPLDVQFIPNPEGTFRPFPYKDDESTILFGESEV